MKEKQSIMQKLFGNYYLGLLLLALYVWGILKIIS